MFYYLLAANIQIFSDKTCLTIEKNLFLSQLLTARNSFNHQEAYLRAVLLQQPPPLIVLQHSHLLDGNLVKLNQSLALWQPLVNEDSIEVFHVGEADEFVDGCIVTNVSFLVGVGFCHCLAVMPNMATLSTSASWA